MNKITKCFMSGLMLFGLSTGVASAQDGDTEAFGLSSGPTTGVGFSYERVQSNDWGLQATVLPAVPNDDTFDSTFALGVRRNLGGNDVVTRYLGVSTLGIFEGTDFAGGSASGVVGVEIAPNERGMTIKLEFPVGVSFDKNLENSEFLTPWIPNVSLMQRW